ncbi:MAG: FAD-linked oxidase C-terminal domain-containing protein [Deltaproteobacteria bacterium]|nr:FAD-linked oxidase C-terminal domain-containing protein [Deltaproteobacteria bacterium]
MRKDLPKDFISRLRDIVGETFAVDDEETLLRHAHDETPNLKPSMPDVVVRPGDVDQVQRVMQLCAKDGVYVTPRGAGSGKAGGCVAVYGGVVLALDRLTRINEIDKENLLARVEPGVILQPFQELVESEGMFYPPDPASLSWCTLGGNVACNAGGPRALKYGVTGTYVLGVDAVLPTGERINPGRSTTKGVAGYDVTSLITGSEGTLAIITGITLKLLPNPRFVQTALAVFPSTEPAVRTVSAILARGILPRTLEYMDRDSIEAVRVMNPPYRFPPNAGACLILETDGESEQGTLEALERCLEVTAEFGAVDAFLAQDAKQRRDIWQSRRLLSEATRKIKKRKVSEDIVVPRSKIPEMVARTGLLGERHKLMTCSFGHAGDGNLHTQILFDDEDDMPRVEALLDDLFDVVLEIGGTITGEHGVGLSKKKYLPKELGPDVVALQQRLKDAFDPKGILNPGKFLPDKILLHAAKADAAAS